MSLYGDEWDCWAAWHTLLTAKGACPPVRRFPSPEHFLCDWRTHLEERVTRAQQELSRLDGVLGLILGGGIGKGDPWPLSDIDILAIYAIDRLEKTRGQVRDVCCHLEAEWEREGFISTIDLSRIVFTDNEASDALTMEPDEAVRLLDAPHWYHGFDKGANGRCLYDPTGLTRPFLTWLTAARTTAGVITERRRRRPLPSSDCLSRAWPMVESGTELEANLAVRAVFASFILYVQTTHWGDSGKLGRNCTRFERLAEQHGEGSFGRRLMALWSPVPPDTHRWDGAPVFVHDRHHVSLLARHAAGEHVSEAEDARDVLELFANLEVSQHTAPYAEWTGLQASRQILTERLTSLEGLISDWPALKSNTKPV